jgi:preprotein translocase subunit SecB
MQKAAFSIKNYCFDKVNIDLSKNISKEIELSFNTKGIFIEKESLFQLIFSIKAFNENNSDIIYVRCIGDFSFENVREFSEIPDFFYRNSIAILFPYLRAYVSLITTQANIPGIILPTLNLSSLEKELRNNTTQK